MGVEVRVPHPRVLCEGGGFDFRPHKTVVTKIDSQQSEVFLERAVLTMRNHRQQPQKSKRKRACPDQCFSFNPLAIIGNQIKTPALENRQGRGTLFIILLGELPQCYYRFGLWNKECHSMEIQWRRMAHTQVLPLPWRWLYARPLETRRPEDSKSRVRRTRRARSGPRRHRLSSRSE